MSKKRIMIARPVAMPGDKVEVLNNRCRPSKWEIGTCNAVASYWNNYSNIVHHYDVVLDRKSKGGNTLAVTVSCNDIKKATS